MCAETHVGLNVKCPLFLADLNEKGNGPTFFLNIHQYQISGVLYACSEAPYRPFRSDVNAFKNQNSPFVFIKYFGVLGEVG
jgi:hypothetical protein